MGKIKSEVHLEYFHTLVVFISVLPLELSGSSLSLNLIILPPVDLIQVFIFRSKLN